ncbi:hypothetical protein IM753_07150 [Moraxella sp. K127]|uniref:hypothetical protein n=1 Tax=Moraxella sp. K127 TaxID=2780079 RepID=UPI00187FBCA5|nr:hypothetical protein [Moraxella sp. K127]MBE9590758.1 hypothetical protein [Moraxella sp. K127]
MSGLFGKLPASVLYSWATTKPICAKRHDMITLQKFERLITAPLAQKPVTLTYFDQTGANLSTWATTLSIRPKHEQYTELRTALSEVLVCDMHDGQKLALMDELMVVVERVVGQMHADYVYEHQSLSDEQRSSVHEVRSLYFLMILVYRNIAVRHQNAVVSAHGGGKKWLNKIMSAKKSGVLTAERDIFIYAVHQFMVLYVKLLMEYALTYQKAPKVIWREVNTWYLTTLNLGVCHESIQDFDKNYPKTSIHDRYMQACGASFGNFFAYRRQDILNAFKVLPLWVKYFKTTFDANPEFRVFVNLQGAEPPEVITPYASVNPYSDEHRCLFFDLEGFTRHMEQVSSGEYIDGTAQSLFEMRFAKMVLLAFEQRSSHDRQDDRHERKAELLVGFASIFNEISGGQNLSTVIRERGLPADFHVKISASAIGMVAPKEMVKVSYKNEAVARFRFGAQGMDEKDEILSSRPLIHLYGLFALKSAISTNKNPWRLGMAHWVEKSDNSVAVDGRFLGRVLMAVGIRLRKQDGRSQEFVHALLVDGDGLNEQSTLIMPRYHFKVGDYVVLRIDTKEMELRLERNLLTTDEIEQYQIVRLNG